MFKNFILFLCFIFIFISCGQSNFEQALKYQNNEEYDKALEFYKKAVSKNENIAQAEKNMGDIYFSQKEFNKAFEHYKNYIENTPDVSLDRVFKFISDRNEDIRNNVRNMLVTIQNKTVKEKILTHLSEMLKSDKQFEKIDALEIVSSLGKASEPIINDVVELINDKNITVKQKVFEVLPKIADVAIPAGAIEKLFALLNDPNDMIKSGAIDCIGNMKQINDYSPLIEISKTKPAIRKIVEGTIKKLNPPSKEAAQNIKKYLKDENPQIRALALSVFAKMENNVGPFVPEIILLSIDNNTTVSKMAKNILSTAKSTDPSTVPDLIKLLDNKNKNIKLEAIRWLANIGAGASDSIEKLQKLAKDEDKEINSSALLALKLIKN